MIYNRRRYAVLLAAAAAAHIRNNKLFMETAADEIPVGRSVGVYPRRNLIVTTRVAAPRSALAARNGRFSGRPCDPHSRSARLRLVRETNGETRAFDSHGKPAYVPAAYSGRSAAPSAGALRRGGPAAGRRLPFAARARPRVRGSGRVRADRGRGEYARCTPLRTCAPGISSR